jgi:hypothetical protein
MALIITINVVCINWLVVISHLKANEPHFAEQLAAWSQCVLRSGADTSECESMANAVIPVWRLWVQEVFISLTGIEMFLIEASQWYVSRVFLMVGVSGEDG